jgi:hypothetical protein
MNKLKQQIKEDPGYANITPRVSFLLQLFFLDIITRADNKELNDWIRENEDNDQLFDLLITYNCRNLSDFQQLKKVATYANISSHAVTLLHRFFLDIATGKDKKEIDNWMHESMANDRLFDLLLDVGHKKPGAYTMRVFRKLAKKSHIRRSRFRKTSFFSLYK